MSQKFLVPIQLPADPTNPLEAATKQYVDSKAGGGAGTDEVWVGTADPRPANPTIELWYDSDEPSVALGDVFVGPNDPGMAYDLWVDTDAPSPSILVPSNIGTENNKPAAPAQPMEYFATDTKRLWLWDGTGWIIMSEPLQSNFTPVVTPAAGTCTATAVFRYNRRDGWMGWHAVISMSSTGTGAGSLNMTLPVAPAYAGTQMVGTGRESNVNGNMLNVLASTGASCAIFTYNNLWPGANGASLGIGGNYLMGSKYS